MVETEEKAIPLTSVYMTSLARLGTGV